MSPINLHDPNALVLMAEPTSPIANGFDTAILAGTRSSATIEQYKLHFASYLVFAGTFANAVLPETLARWRQHLFETGYMGKDGMRKPYSIAAINQRLASVRAVVAEAAQQGFIAHEVAEAFKNVKGLKLAANKDRRNPHARTAITRADMQRICDAPDTSTLAGKMHRALLLTLATSGVRISEAVSMRLDQFQWGIDDDGKAGWMIMIAGKNEIDEKPRALGAQAKAAVAAWLEARSAAGIDSEFVFTHFTGRGDRNPQTEPISRVSAWQMVKRYAHRVGLDHVKPHDFRRFVGTQLAKRDIRLAQNQLGHKRIETTAQHYVLDTVRLGVTDDLLA